ncbi:sensor histidine kinase [Amycolatopsis pigmentata]|uniref:histidine kinase n=1 Tax=Amycolatopsis pigmentata TaxID=450801 RepID=A0ABW5G689_9PSEU
MRREVTAKVSGFAGNAPAFFRALPRWREWNMTVKFAAMLVVPVVIALVAGAGLLWRSADTRAAARRDEQIVHIGHQLVTTVAAVEAERAATTGAMRQGGVSGPLEDARAEVNSAMAQLGSLLGEVSGDRAAEVAAGQLARLDDARNNVDPVAMNARYSAIVDALIDLDATLAGKITDGATAAHLTAAHTLSEAREYVARQQSLLEIGLTTGGLGHAGLGDARDATALAANRLARFTASAPGEDLAAYSAAVPADAIGERNKLVTAMLGDDGGFKPSVSVQQWRAVGQPVADKLGAAVSRLSDSVSATASAKVTEAVSAQRNLAIALVAAALAASTLIIVILRYLRATVRSLRVAALDIAQRKLPETLLAVRDGRDGGVDRPRLPVFADDDFGALALAFDSVCGEAITAVGEQAKMRSGYAEVFVNMFRRTQSLVQRQLRVLEQLEEKESSAEQLSMLFQLDHLVTRMRRNNENVLVISGTELVRKAAKPIPLSSVFQAALSEIEAYQRVEVLDPPSAKIIGNAATDLIRMLAELLDNATSFSPPEKTVTIQGQVLRDGSLSIAVVDNGSGMSDEEVQRVNERLTQVGSMDLARSRRVGLLVVGRLAGKHGFGVELLGGDASPGVTALISVPSELVIEAERPGWADRRMAMKAASQRGAEATKAEQLATVGGNGRGSRRLVSVSNPGATPAVESGVPTGAPVGTPDTVVDERTRERLVEQAHANVPEDLPVRVPNRRIGKAGADGKSAAERAASAWFRARDTASRPREVSVAPELEGEAPPKNWLSAADEGWSIVETVSQTARYTYTEDGLPIREKGAHLLPGSARSGGSGKRAPIERDPANTRSRISSFQQGVRKAKDSDGSAPPRKPGAWRSLSRKQ